MKYLIITFLVGLIVFSFSWLVVEILNLLQIYIKYKLSGYESKTGNKFSDIYFKNNSESIGKYGEYLTLTQLNKIISYKKILLNLYIPMKNNTTTEIDLIMIHKTGIYVIESKNFTGKIRGKYNWRNWTQRLPDEQIKEFYNPIKQNEMHIAYLRKILANVYDGKYFSYIVFSERCNLNCVTRYGNYSVLRRSYLLSNIKRRIRGNNNIINVDKIDEIYNTLKKYSNVNDEIKEKHIENIKNNNFNKKVIKKSYDKIITDLKEYRLNCSKKENIPSYIIFNDQTMYSLANARPKNIYQLTFIKGFGEVKIEKYGKDIINIINN